VGRWAKDRPREIGVRLSIPHEMTRTRALERGAEEWSCTQCSRRLLFRWQPRFERVVLDRGDERVAHVGGAGGMQMTSATVERTGHGDLRGYDREWLEAQGIDWGPEHTP
jgi:hypothetical protein